jgi:hypothetical protein
MQTKKRRRYAPILLCLLPVHVFVLVDNVLDDRNTGPLPISAIRTMLNGENARKWRVYKTLPLPLDLLLH